MKYIEVQQKLQKKVFSNPNLNKSIEVQRYDLVENSYGEQTEEFIEQEVLQGVVLNYTKHKKEYDSDGLYDDSSFILLLPHNSNINQYSVVVFDNQEFSITQINKQPFGDGFTHLTIFVKNTI